MARAIAIEDRVAEVIENLSLVFFQGSRSLVSLQTGPTLFLAFLLLTTYLQKHFLLSLARLVILVIHGQTQFCMGLGFPKFVISFWFWLHRQDFHYVVHIRTMNQYFNIRKLILK